MPLVSKTEAAKLAGVTRQTIHRKVKSGDLSAIGGEIDTSELLRVFGTLQRPLDIADQDSGNKAWATKPDPAVEVLARVDVLESQLAVTREQLADTSKDRDEWREIAKEATSNVKLITNQGSAPKNNDNIAIFVAGAFALGLLVTAMYFMTQQNQPVTITPESVAETPLLPDGSIDYATLAKEYGGVFTPNPKEETTTDEPDSILTEDKPYSIVTKDGIKINNISAHIPSDAEILKRGVAEEREKRKSIDGIELYDRFVQGIDFGNLVAVPVEEAEQGADVTDSVTPELQADNGSN